MQQVTPSSVASPVQSNALPSAPLELHDIHVPEQIANYPMAYGWWLLASLLIIAIVFFIYKFRQNAKLKQQQRQALTQLKEVPNMSNSEVLALLKWAAMQYFPRGQLAMLYGEQFQQFLIQKLPEKHQEKFNQLSTSAFSQQYQTQCIEVEQAGANTNSNLHQAARLWLTQALPPKQQKAEHQAANKQIGANA
ncbi:MAG: DUF4381 domain-containing protein [Colwellia sp.]|nr:DUF4381 domain-containing protein [Colwellia sp.]MCW9080730.1 DUF4381 domain-containing protein [Colwellia sp.]